MLETRGTGLVEKKLSQWEEPDDYLYRTNQWKSDFLKRKKQVWSYTINAKVNIVKEVEMYN